MNHTSILTIFALLFGCSAFGQTTPSKTPEAVPECHGVIHGSVFAPDGNPWGGVTLILDPPGDIDYILRNTKSNDLGEFLFEKVCNGIWGVFVQDAKAGCPYCDRYQNKFLFGNIPPDVRVIATSPDVQVDVHAPPKPGMLVVRLLNRETNAAIPKGRLELWVNRKRWEEPSRDETTALTCDGGTVQVPPGIAVKLRIRAKGFHEWKTGAGHGQILNIPSGETQTVVAELAPER